jgi:cytochrome o ubiquinol oxidase subunit 2
MPKTYLTGRRLSWLPQAVTTAAKWCVVIAALVGLTACGKDLGGVLHPKGLVALQERKLLFDTMALMLIVVLPVIVMSFTFVYHYQASHRVRDYKPNWSHSYFLESLWWGIPCVLIVILAIVTWKETHKLDPYQRIAGQTEAPLQVQVIAVPWKWVFIYPEQHVATVNYLAVPVGRQVEFWITTDNVPMSAFFIPQLGSQIYSMTAMRTRLHLLATEVGDFVGMNTQINGDGFSDMRFMAHAMMPEQLQAWFTQVSQSPDKLTMATYETLLKPSIKNAPQFFSYDGKEDLFQTVIDIYMNSEGPVHPRAAIAPYQQLVN